MSIKKNNAYYEENGKIYYYDDAGVREAVPDSAFGDTAEKLANLYSNSDCVYIDPENGDDTKDGLTRNTAVKTFTGAIEAFRTADFPKDKFKVYVLSSSTIKLPRGEMLDFMQSPNLYLFADTIAVTYPDHIQGYINLNYPVYITADSYVSAEFPRMADYCTGDISIKCGGNIHLTSCVTSEHIKLDAAGDILLGTNFWQGQTTKSITINCNTLDASSARIQTDGILRINTKSNASLNSATGGYIELNIGGALTVLGNTDIFGNPGLHSTEHTRIFTGKIDTNSIINNFTTDGYAYLEGDKFTIGAQYTIGTDFTIKCNEYYVRPGTNTFHGNVTIYAEKLVDFMNGGNIYVDGKTKIICNGNVEFSPMYFDNYMEVNTLGYCRVYTLMPKTANPNSIHKYIFNVGSSMTDSIYTAAGCFETYYSGIQNPYADVVINCTGIVRLCKSNTAQYCRSLDIHAHDLVLYSSVYTGFFHIDVANQVEQSNPGCNIIMSLSSGTVGEDNYISYDTQSENSLKCGALYCSIYYNMLDYGLIQPYYGNAIKNIDIQVGMILAPSYNGSGAQTPIVLGPCRSGQGSFNSTISGHVGGYVGHNSPNIKISPWNHDIRSIHSSYQGTSNYPNPNDHTYGIITLKFDDVYETNHFYFDPNQGDDTLDGCTRQTAVKTTSALMRCMMRKANGSYSNNTFTFYNGISIHILSTDTGSMYSAETPTSLSSLTNINNYFSSGRGIDFTFMYSYGGAKASFQFIEFIPEAPDMSLYVRGMVADVIQARGFNGIYFSCVDTKDDYSGLCLLEAVNSIAIYNSSNYGGFNFYSKRFNCLTARARSICLAGMFNTLNAMAEDYLYVYDTTGASSDTIGNCCIIGNSKLEAKELNLGSAGNYIGINGSCSIKGHRGVTTYVDSFVNAVCHIDCDDNVSGVFASRYFKGRLCVNCVTCNLGRDNDNYSFNTYDATINDGGAGIISIKATKQITANYWGNTDSPSYLYGVDLYLDAPYITGNTMYIYGNNGGSRIIINAPYQFSINMLPYYCSTFGLTAGTVTAPIGAYSGGPISPTGNTGMALRFDINELQQPIRLYTSQMSSYTSYYIRGHIDYASCKILDWGQEIDPDNPPSITTGVTFNFALTVGHSSIAGHDIDKTGWIPDNSGTIIVLNDEKQLVAGDGISISDTGDNVVVASETRMVEIPVVVDALDDTQCSATLVLNKYNVITGLDEYVTDMDIIIPSAGQSVLREVGFEFAPVSGNSLSAVNFFGEGGIPLFEITPEEYYYGCMYQGAAVNRCVTLVEYGEPVEPETLVIDGREYRTVTMPDGSVWMAENLAADSFGGIWYNNDETTYGEYGKLYSQADQANIVVPGWHIPTLKEYASMMESIGVDIEDSSTYSNLAMLKTSTWYDASTEAPMTYNDESGFGVLPAGLATVYMDNPMDCVGIDHVAMLRLGEVYRYMQLYSVDGSETLYVAPLYDVTLLYLSVRLVKDQPDDLIIDGRRYETKTMPDGRVWMTENLAADSFGGEWFDNNPYNYWMYGKYYTPTEITTINSSVPGWHVPTEAEWRALVESTGPDYANAGVQKLKSRYTWNDTASYPNTDDYGFTLMGAGWVFRYREAGYTYYEHMGEHAHQILPESPGRYVDIHGEWFSVYNYSDSYYLISTPVRLIKDAE